MGKRTRSSPTTLYCIETAASMKRPRRLQLQLQLQLEVTPEQDQQPCLEKQDSVEAQAQAQDQTTEHMKEVYYYNAPTDYTGLEQYLGMEVCSGCSKVNYYKYHVPLPVVYERCVCCNHHFCEDCIDVCRSSSKNNNQWQCFFCQNVKG